MDRSNRPLLHRLTHLSTCFVHVKDMSSILLDSASSWLRQINEHPNPRGELTLRTVAMPADTNPSGDIIGGWVIAQMDLAGGVAERRSEGRVVRVAVDGMHFIRPVKVGDILCVCTSSNILAEHR